MKTMKKRMTWLSVLLVGLLMSACGGHSNKREIKIAYVNWEESIAMSNVAKTILESEGYKVTLMNADIAPVFASLSRKRADVFTNVWLPKMHKNYMDKYGDKLEKLNVNYNNGRIGLVVPQYMDIDSISQLSSVAQAVHSEIIGIDPGAGAMKAAANAITTYKLDGFKLLTASEPAMTASLKKAYEAHKPIVVVGWTPHWMFNRYKLKFLVDPQFVMGKVENIETYAWKGYAAHDPYAAAFFGNIKYTDETIASLMSTFKKFNKPEDAAKAWIQDHQELVNSWIPAH